MQRLATLALLMVAGCGRLGFEADAAQAQPPDAGAADGPNAHATIGPCNARVPIPDPVIAAGTLVEVPVYGAPAPESGVTIEASAMPAGVPFAATTSAADGGYSLDVTSHGEPMRVYFAARKPGLLTSVFVPDGPVDGDIVDLYSPIATDAAVSSLYLTAGVLRNASSGTLLVMVTDCAGVAVTDAAVAITPAPARVIYTDDAGSPSTSLTTTRAKGLVYAIDLTPGVVLVTASKAGATFFTHQVEILDSTYVMGTRLRAVRTPQSR